MLIFIVRGVKKTINNRIAAIILNSGNKTKKKMLRPRKFLLKKGPLLNSDKAKQLHLTKDKNKKNNLITQIQSKD